MLKLLLVVLSVYLANSLQKPNFETDRNGGTFTYEDRPGIKDLLFVYTSDGAEQKFGSGVLQDDKKWHYTDTDLANSKEIHYHVEISFENGETYEGSEEIWKRVPLAVLAPRRMRGVVSFRDDFNGNHLDSKHWFTQVTAAGEWHTEFQVYVNDPRNVFVKNGHLYIKPWPYTENDLYHGVLDVKKTWGTCTDAGNRGCYREGKDGLLPPILSGRIDSKPTLKYGHVTVRAQIPRGDWIWPAIWMMPRQNNYGLWPRSGEIDFMEAACNEVAVWNNGQKVGIQRVQSTLHFGTDYDHDHPVPGWKYKTTGDWHGFHTYELDWSPNHIILSVDGDVVTRMDIPEGSSVWKHYNLKGKNPWVHGTKIAPFDHEFYMILNVAVGGVYSMFGDYDTHYAYPKPWHNTDKDPLKNFWEARKNWLPTWHGDDVAMIVDFVEFRHM